MMIYQMFPIFLK